MNHAPRLFIAALCLAAGSPFAHAADDAPHLYDAAKADAALSAEFQRVTAPIVQQAPWVRTFGTTAPAATESLDDRSYDVFWGCKPHDCISESYVVMYDRQAKRITAGAFVRNTFSGPKLTSSGITWLGQAEVDEARLLGKYLY